MQPWLGPSFRGFQTLGLFRSCEIQRATSSDELNSINTPGQRIRTDNRSVLRKEEDAGTNQWKAVAISHSFDEREGQSGYFGPACISWSRIQSLSGPTNPKAPKVVDAAHGPICGLPEVLPKKLCGRLGPLISSCEQHVDRSSNEPFCKGDAGLCICIMHHALCWLFFRIGVFVFLSHIPLRARKVGC